MTLARPRLLVVDDDRAVLSTLVSGLSRAGFEVVVATNGDEAIRIAVDARPALVVLDVTMAGRKGLDVAQSFARESRVPLLLLAPLRDEAEVRRQASAFGAGGGAATPGHWPRGGPPSGGARARADQPARDGEGAGLLADALGGDHGPQELIALGILVERHKVNCDEAVRILHQRAADAGLPIDEVALAVIEQAEGATRLPV